MSSMIFVTTKFLFSDVPITDRFQKIREHVAADIAGLDDDDILSCDVDATVTEILKPYRIEFPTLQPPVTDSVMPLPSQGPRSGPLGSQAGQFRSKAGCTQFITKISIPFTGEPEIFRTKPKVQPVPPPGAAIHQSVINYTSIDVAPDGDALKRKIESLIFVINQYLSLLSTEWELMFSELSRDTKAELSQRRDDLLLAKQVVSALGYPLRRRNDLSGIAVPVVRKSILADFQRDMVRPIAREPYIEEKIYGEILKVLASMSLLIERNPTTFAHIDEQSLRDHFLLQLNGQFEGKATGETFNGAGKTDILLRERDKNLFIAECKFWDGPKSLTDAIDQLHSYLTWRDSKAAILVFSRNKNFTRTIEDAGRTLREHPQFRQTLESQRETSLRAFIERRDDDQRRIDLTVMLFNVIPKADV